MESEHGPRNALLAPERLKRIGAFEAFLAAQTDARVGRVVDPHEHLTTTRFLLHARDPAYRSVPETPIEVEAVLSHYLRVRGAEKLEQVLNVDRSRGSVTVFLQDADFVAVGELLDAIESYRIDQLEPFGLELYRGGDIARSQALIKAVVGMQMRSLIFALIGIVLVAATTLRSPRLGLFRAIPPALAVLAVLALMGFTGMTLGVATSMFAGMTIGIGVDNAIHLALRTRRSRRHGRTAVIAAVRTTSPAIVIDALALTLAFGLLMLSSVPADARLGGLMVISSLTCLLATLGVLPTLPARGVARGR